MSSIVRAARIGIGGISTLLSLLMLALIQRQFSMWNATREGYYFLSTGLYIVVLLVLLLGVSWGLRTGEAAEQIWKATSGIIVAIVSLATAYYVITGFALGGGVNSTFAALVSVVTAIAVNMIFYLTLNLSDKRLS